MIWSFSDSMTTCTEVCLPSFIVFVEETLDVIICNGFAVGISCGAARSKSICDSLIETTPLYIIKAIEQYYVWSFSGLNTA